MNHNYESQLQVTFTSHTYKSQLRVTTMSHNYKLQLWVTSPQRWQRHSVRLNTAKIDFCWASHVLDSDGTGLCSSYLQGNLISWWPMVLYHIVRNWSNALHYTSVRIVGYYPWHRLDAQSHHPRQGWTSQQLLVLRNWQMCNSSRPPSSSTFFCLKMICLKKSTLFHEYF
jgi:hypothetical protein